MTAMTTVQVSNLLVLGGALLVAFWFLWLFVCIEEGVYRASRRFSLWWLLGGPERVLCRIGVALLWLPCLLEQAFWFTVDLLHATWLRTQRIAANAVESARAWSTVVRVR